MASLAASLRSPGEQIPSVEDGFSLPLKVAGMSGAAWGLVVWVQLTVLGLLGLAHLPALVGLGGALGLVGPAVAAATVHPLVYLFGGGRYELTYKVFGLYAPVGVLGGVLGLNLLAFPALFALEVRGLKSVHDLSWVEAAAAMSAPAVVLSLVGVAVGLASISAGIVAIPSLPG
nr:MAG: hypothetical protein J07AB56_11720 [Candidatus Nanosalinarum sp. J07AB56]